MKPLVSVLITNYNNTDKVGRAIQSVLEQKTKFGVEVIIADDNSSDDSVQQITGAIKNRRGKEITLLVSDHRLGMIKNYIRGFKECRGEYIAICDSDDYWTDYQKLQKQVDFMQLHPEYGICFTDIESNGKIGKFGHTDYGRLLRGACIPSPSVLMRNIFPQALEWIPYEKFCIWDYPLYLLFASFSDIYYMKGVTAYWTASKESVTQTRSRHKRWLYVWGTMKIKLYFILHNRCRTSTLLYVLYRFLRDVVSIILRRWYK